MQVEIDIIAFEHVKVLYEFSARYNYHYLIIIITLTEHKFVWSLQKKLLHCT